ncbi:transglutaminase-like domain-containing protein [uncultured Winogradskyella sp.]|uniref:transglutaminase-like domain-containing protein n=1 Tax=uncultured Winogradskyella sp. TaxID=395353 RepID=UPI00261BA595|nr:transglutaminase-like domain-containing protein [uncultured Winogradskyella sp.]
MNLRNISWFLKRHPFLYLTRFRLLSKNSTIGDIENHSYNKLNSKKDIPEIFYDINKKIFDQEKPHSHLEQAKQISIWLFENIKGGPGLSESSAKALKRMLDGKGGVCSDVAQIFNNFCVINDIEVREWGITRTPFNTNYGGHSFNEVYCNLLNKWVLLDSSCCIMFYGKTDTALSVIELYQLVRSHQYVVYKSFNNSIGIREKNIKKNYFNKDTTPFLISNYSNKVYDKFLSYRNKYIPVFVVHFIIYFLGRSYYYNFPLDNYKNIFIKN